MGARVGSVEWEEEAPEEGHVGPQEALRRFER